MYWRVSRWVGLVLRLVCEVLVSVSCVSRLPPVSFYRYMYSTEVKSIRKQQTTIRKPIECAPEASSGGREWAEMTEGFHLEVTRRKVLTYVPSEKK